MKARENVKLLRLYTYTEKNDKIETFKLRE